MKKLSGVWLILVYLGSGFYAFTATKDSPSILGAKALFSILTVMFTATAFIYVVEKKE